MEDSKRAAEEDKEWSKGAKTNAKKYDNAYTFWHTIRKLTRPVSA